MGIVYLTGAGPGDLELLTIKALKVIKKADVIVYDKLVNSDILKEAKDGCRFIYVGKEDGKHILPQDEINELLYELSKENDIVVRLKGGDPVVFGRGGEEALYLRDRGVEFEFIPGVSSVIAVPEYAGIPITHRGINIGFKVLTGHEAVNKEKSLIDWKSLSSDDTIIFMMGLHNIEKIAKKLIDIGKPKDYPIAVISQGTTPNQKCVTGTLENISKKSKDMPTPALIVVGRVVDLKEKLEWYKK